MLAFICALIAAASVIVPLYVIRPFVPQDPGQLTMALTVRSWAPWISALCALVAVWALFAGWKSARVIGKIVLVLLLLVSVAGATLTHVNVFEVMFKPYPAPAFESPATTQVDGDDKVLAVTIGGESHAYPIRTMGYHHIVNDTVGGTPVAATYCTLCHTGLIFSRVLDGQTLTFRLTGINNGNAMLRDEQTSTVWQQSTGEALWGPLKGKRLTVLHSDELTFATWRNEQPKGMVLKPNALYAGDYESKNWDTGITRNPTVVDTSHTGYIPYELMWGVAVDGQSKAYPIKAILSAGLVEDRVGDTPVLIVVGPDHTSIRTFKAQLPGQPESLTFVTAAGSGLMTDTGTGSAWDFHGCAISGSYSGRCMEPIEAHKTFWFDWMHHNPSTTVFKS